LPFFLKKTLKVVWSQVFLFSKIRFFFQIYSIFETPQFEFHKYHQSKDY
jgi:hypothetical protein